MSRLVDHFMNALAGEAMPREVLELSLSNASAQDDYTSVVANGILLLQGSKMQQEQACERLRAFAGRFGHHTPLNSAAMLLLAIELVPRLKDPKNEAMVRFSFSAIQHPSAPVRVNAIRVLRRLAKGRDLEAVEFLNRAMHDPDSIVSKAARKAVDILGDAAEPSS